MLTRRRNYEVTGFSLIEMMIGITILGLLMMSAMPSFRTWIGNTKIRNMAESIQNGLMKARQEAVHRNEPVQFVLSGAGWVVGCETVTANCPATIEAKSAMEGTDSSISVTTTAGIATVVFDQFGRRKLPAAATGTITFDIDSTSLTSTDSRDLRITIRAGGGVRMCDPNVTATTDPRHC